MKSIFNNVWVKCISCLLILSVILGGSLALLNDLLYVTPAERTSRAIKNIYGQEMTFDTVLDVDNVERTDTAIEYSDYGKITKIYNVGQDVLYQAIGYNGYKNGTITLWIKTISDGQRITIDKIIVESYTKQTLMGKIDGAYLGLFYDDITDSYQNLYTPKDDDKENYAPLTGATMSANAVCNAVNCVVLYLGGGNA